MEGESVTQNYDEWYTALEKEENSLLYLFKQIIDIEDGILLYESYPLVYSFGKGVTGDRNADNSGMSSDDSGKRHKCVTNGWNKGNGHKHILLLILCRHGDKTASRTAVDKNNWKIASLETADFMKTGPGQS
ncbi:hypothetical protein M513_06010 [Trichuris suis]|uniref:Uncharacterized protein n=1 Tax=Trichuris suis TaxID=68888 RepID=A0A085M7A0_9BILA|nr:hypothetical protein M513_06010 [Trichuris suis]